MPQDRIVQLRRELARHNELYYQKAQPEISDEQYDRLMQELIDLEKQHPQFKSEDSPSALVGEETQDGFGSVKHALRMMSIDNTYDEAEVRAFDQRVRKILSESSTRPLDEPVAYVVEPKIDGVAVSLRYERGTLVQAATRGNGIYGDDITTNAKTIASIPHQLMLPPGSTTHPAVLEVRGEIFMTAAAFAKANEARVAEGEAPFQNPRNATAGTIKQLDAAVVKSRGLDFLGHGIGQIIGADVSTYWQWLKLLESLGLPTADRAKRVMGIDAVLAEIAAFAKDRDDLPFATDGMVVKVDEFSLRDLLGTTSKSPRWAMAFKYAAEQVSTKLLSVTWQVGKNGQLTPVAELEPVFVSGTTVRRATMHNMDQVRRLGVHEGDRLVVEKAGEIIPYIVRVDGDHAPGALPISPPEFCPCCGSKVVQEEGTPILRCDNPQCPDQLKERLRWFCGRNQMDIEGMGEKIIEQLVDSGQVKTFADLFLLKAETLSGMERMGEKSAANLLASLEQAKTRSLDRLLTGLGIRHVGVGGGRALAARFASLDELAEASIEQLSEVRDVGTIVAQSVKDFFSSAVGQEIVRSLKAAGVSPTSALPAGDRPQPFAGKSIVVTGSLKRFGRDEIERLIATLGGKPSGSVSKKTAFLVAGQDAGSKLAKANDLGVEVIDEEEFARRAGV